MDAARLDVVLRALLLWECVEDFVFEGDAVVGVGVVGGDVERFDGGVAGFGEVGGEGLAGGAGAVVGVDDEDGAVGIGG